MRILLLGMLTSLLWGQANYGKYGGMLLGPNENLYGSLAATAPTTYDLKANAAGWCTRFTASRAVPFKSISTSFTTITAPNTVTATIEVIDATTGKPTGGIYDANATVTATPASGWNTFTFASDPTTNPTVGSEYCAMLVSNGASTAMLLQSHLGAGGYPTAVMTTATAGTRSSFAEVSGSVPIITLTYTDGVEEAIWAMPLSARATFQMYGTRSMGLKFVLSVPMTIWGYRLLYMTRTGTPTGDLRCQVRDTTDAVVTGTLRVADKDSLTGVAAKNIAMYLPAPVKLSAGTYRAVCDQTDHASTVSNYFGVAYMTWKSASLAPSGYNFTWTANMDAGPPISWTDNSDTVPNIQLFVADIPLAGGGSYATAQ